MNAPVVEILLLLVSDDRFDPLRFGWVPNQARSLVVKPFGYNGGMFRGMTVLLGVDASTLLSLLLVLGGPEFQRLLICVVDRGV